MAKRGDIVVMDTNAIIECFRLKCWRPLSGAFGIETTNECAVECATGNRSRKDYTEIDVELVRASAQVHAVPRDAIAAVRLRLGVLPDIDPGEAEILALMLAEPGARLVYSPDKACLRGLHILGMIDRAVALEELGNLAGLRLDWRPNFTKRWLNSYCGTLILDSL